MGLPGCLLATAVVTAIAIGIGLGVLIGHLTTTPHCTDTDRPANRGDAVKNETFLRQVLDSVSASNMRDNLRVFASRPHTAGSDRDLELANHVRASWLRDGLDAAHLVPYRVLLSLPHPTKRNQVSLLDRAGKVLYQSSLVDGPGEPEADGKKEAKSKTGAETLQAYNAYAPNGSVTGPLVYANFGTEEDFALLAAMGVNVTGAICLVRNGNIFRGNKVQNAERRGAAGVLLYSDPEAVSPRGTAAGDVFPSTVFLPPTFAQWGAVFTDIGDPLTPHWPSIEGAFRLNETEAMLPKIPSQPISYSDALYFLKLLSGKEVPEDWTGFGGLPARAGPGFRDPGQLVRMEVHNELRETVVYNVIGSLRGAVEPDRYVIQGNHRDSWAFGASDPSSGTAQLMETARVFGQLARQGWRPRRTLIFASWAAEEFGVIGSQEWVEEHAVRVASRTVAYVNTDVCVSGPDLELSASASLHRMAQNAARAVQSPTSRGETVFQKWKKTFPNGTPEDEMIFAVGSGTDVAPFAFYAGVPVADIWFRVDQKRHNVSMYPAYHTGIDTLVLMESLVDPDLAIHRACGQMATAMLLDLADSVLLPLEPTDLARAMRKALKSLEESSVRKQIEAEGLTLRFLDYAVGNFSQAASDWTKRLATVQLDELSARSLNDQLMLSERCLVLPAGLPGRANSRHSVFSPSRDDAYTGAAFSGLTDLLLELDSCADETAARKVRAAIALHITEVVVRISEAAAALQPV